LAKTIGFQHFLPPPQQSWIWPQEGKALWTVYPYNGGTGQGVKQGANPGDPPQFFGDWYLESPQSNKWDPYCP